MPYVQRPRPLISSRIEFTMVLPLHLPAIRSRIEFTAERLTRMDRGVDDALELEHHRFMDDNLGAQTDAHSQSSASGPSIQAPSIAKKNPPMAMIPKPPGEPGRPRSGGFSVDDTLIKSHGWSKQSVEKLTVCFLIIFGRKNAGLMIKSIDCYSRCS